jgi:prepilin-type N-terminal cleavage/methylation domain-containing protein
MINKIKNSGFTLIETLIAVLLLAMAITGPLSIASKGLTATLVAKDQFVAFYLAQDAIEQVRFLRDSACLASGGGPTGCPSGSWLSSLNSCLTSVNPDGCTLDSVQSTVASCTGACPPLNYDPANNFFSYTSGAVTPQHFIRTVKIQNDPAGTSPDEAIVTVTVSWTDVAGQVHMPVTVRENLFRWQ